MAQPLVSSSDASNRPAGSKAFLPPPIVHLVTSGFVVGSQIRTPSLPLLARRLPSGLKATEVTRDTWPRNVAASAPVVCVFSAPRSTNCQMRIVRSDPATARNTPSRLKPTSDVCSGRLRNDLCKVPVVASIRSTPSGQPQAMTFESDETASGPEQGGVSLRINSPVG